MFPSAHARRLARAAITLVAALVVLVAAGCSRPEESSTDFTIEMHVTPSPPVEGVVQIELLLKDADGAMVTATSVKLEGNMNHAGMKPSFADAKQVSPGKYAADLELTMGGDWYVLVDAVLVDGTKVQRKLDLPGVQAQ